VRLSRPIACVCPGQRGAVLSALARTESPLTGRGVASVVRDRTSLRTVQVVLDDLVQKGLVRRQPAGNAYLYWLNREHLAAPAIESLVDLRSELVNRIRSTVTSWSFPAESVWMFGSAARGDDHDDSDVDLLLERADRTDEDEPLWQQQLTDLASSVHDWTGNACEILEMSRTQLDEAVERDDRLVADLRRDAVHIAGRTPRQALTRRWTR